MHARRIKFKKLKIYFLLNEGQNGHHHEEMKGGVVEREKSVASKRQASTSD